MGVAAGKKGFVAEINVTPFVDVMLVLLIIFMVTAPLMTEGLDVDLPQTSTAKSLPTDKDHVVLTVKKDGSIFLDTYRVNDLAALQAQLATVAAEQRRQVFLQADKEVAYGVVAEVMARLRAAGVDKLGMVTEQVTDPAPNAGGGAKRR